MEIPRIESNSSQKSCLFSGDLISMPPTVFNFYCKIFASLWAGSTLWHGGERVFAQLLDLSSCIYCRVAFAASLVAVLVLLRFLDKKNNSKPQNQSHSWALKMVQGWVESKFGLCGFSPIVAGMQYLQLCAHFQGGNRTPRLSLQIKHWVAGCRRDFFFSCVCGSAEIEPDSVASDPVCWAWRWSKKRNAWTWGSKVWQFFKVRWGDPPEENRVEITA